MFWNLARFNNGAPLLAALVSGPSARAAEGADTEELQHHMLQVKPQMRHHDHCAGHLSTC
jgi:hypothetical protein